MSTAPTYLEAVGAQTRLEGAVSAVRTLHSRRAFDGDGYGWSVCAECRQSWPCATERAIEAALTL